MDSFNIREYLTEGWLFKEVYKRKTGFRKSPLRQMKKALRDWYLKHRVDKSQSDQAVVNHLRREVRPNLTREEQHWFDWYMDRQCSVPGNFHKFLEKLLTLPSEYFDEEERYYLDAEENLDEAEGWLLKESNEDHILFNRVEELVKELADSDGIVDLRPANLDLTWIDEEDDSAEEIGAYMLSLGKDGKIYVSTGPEDNPMSGDDVTLERYCSLLQENGAIAHDVDVMLDAIVEALEILKEGETELNEAENFNDEKYPKAEAWLEEHPDIKYFNEVPEQFLQYDINTEDDPDQENIETAITEAGYMFISELEAALEGGKDDEYLESCAMNGVINDPTYNPPIDSWDYRIR